MGKEALIHIDEKYRLYHEMKLQEIAESPKRLCYDEFHRTKGPAERLHGRLPEQFQFPGSRVL